MQLLRHIRPGVGPAFDEDRCEREGIGVQAGDPVAPTSHPRDAHLTCRELMAVPRERLAAKGFDWGDAPDGAKVAVR